MKTLLGPDPQQHDPRRELEPELERLAHWMDSAFRVPGLGFRFGLDALIGLIPGLGDTASSLVSLYILNAARRYGIPRVTVLRMALNIAVDYAFGSIPLLGDVFDVYWKSNKRNVALMREHVLANPRQERRASAGDWLFLIAVSCGLAVALAGCILISWIVLARLGQLFFGDWLGRFIFGPAH